MPLLPSFVTIVVGSGDPCHSARILLTAVAKGLMPGRFALILILYEMFTSYFMPLCLPSLLLGLSSIEEAHVIISPNC